MTTAAVRAALSAPETLAPLSDDAAPPRTPGDETGGDAIAAAALQPMNDYGNGQRFVIHFGRDVMFVPRVGWFTWAGTHWAKDPDALAVRRLAQEIGPLILQELDFVRLSDPAAELLAGKDEMQERFDEIAAMEAKERTPEQRLAMVELKSKIKRAEAVEKNFGARQDRLRSHARTAGNSGPLANMLAESQTSLAVPLDALDADSLAVNVENGLLRLRVVDLSAEGGGKVVEVSLDPHDRAHRMTKMMPVSYRPDAPARLWTAFLTRVMPDPELRGFLQRWFGLSMTAEPVQHMAFLYGMGANGKSVLVDTIARVMGDYAATARIESLTGTTRRGGGDATPDLIPLIGARFVRTSEPDEGAKLQEGLIKELTGGEPIMVRALHSDFVEVKPVFKLTMSGNHKPDIRGTDDGIWRRFLMVPFEVQIPEAERDEHLGDRLFAERDGIFAWLVEGAREALEMGLRPPASVVDATAAFRAEQDPVGDFLATCCWVSGDPAQKMPSRDLVESFRYWQMANGTGAWTERTVALRLADKADKWRHPKTGQSFSKRKASTSYFDGIAFTGAWRDEFAQAERDSRGELRPPRGAALAAPHPDEDF